MHGESLLVAWQDSEGFVDRRRAQVGPAGLERGTTGVRVPWTDCRTPPFKPTFPANYGLSLCGSLTDFG
jgi:hypothetical protein